MVPAEEDPPDSSRTDRELREELIEEADQSLRNEGIEGFSTVKIAERCEISRQMIYTLFGGKSGLIKAVYEAKSKELAERLEAVSASDPIDRLFQYGTIYREYMLDHQALFDAIFNLKAVRNFKGPGKLIERNEAFDYFQEAIRTLREEGYLGEETDPEWLTDKLWSAVTGVILLEIVDFYPDEETAEALYYDVAASVLFGNLDEEAPTEDFAQGMGIV